MSLTQKYNSALLKKMLDDYETFFFGTNYNPFSDYNIYFITSNTSTTDLTHFVKSTQSVEKKLNSKRLKNCYTYYTHEFYTNSGNHFHTHILLFKLKKDKRLGKKALIDYFYDKKLMKSKASIDIKQVSSQQSLTRHLNYIGGVKKETKKQNTIKDNQLKHNFNKPLTTKSQFCEISHKQLNRYMLDK